MTDEELPLRDIIFDRIVVRTSGTKFNVSKARDLADEIMDLLEVEDRNDDSGKEFALKD